MIRLSGLLTCVTDAEAETVRQHLPEHVRLTLAEPGCVSFSVLPAGPRSWQVEECFATRADFDAHQARARASDWHLATAGHSLTRRYTITEG